MEPFAYTSLSGGKSDETVDVQERDELLRLGTGEKLDYDRTETFVNMFLRTVKLYPDKTAVVDCKSSLTYHELDTLSDAIAHRLIEDGINSDDFVAVILPRVKEFVASVIGIWKAGAAYVPVDPDYPEERIRHIIEDAEAKVVIDEAFCNGTTSGGCVPVNLSTPGGLAYMIYTSGSTGKPKGVMIQHMALTCFINFTRKEWHLGPNSRISCHSNYAFDSSVEDLYPVLTAGGTLFLPSKEVCMDLEKLVSHLKDNNITGGCYMTQVGQMLAAYYPDIPLDYLTIGGEKMTLAPECSYRLINSYGPTEATVNSTYLVIDPKKDYTDIPIGRPLYNLYAFVCDRNAHLVPKGMNGELCIAGPQLAKGYWHQPELTAEKFIDCPYLPGQKMYRTGDLARWNDDGNLEYLGRIDNQVKIRGFRIEPGEIESAMSKIDGICSAVATVREINGSQRLCAYYVSDSKKNESTLKTTLSKSLPDYMVPDVFLRLDALPLAPSGKIDYKALPEVNLSAGGEIVAPRTLREQELMDIIRETVNPGTFGVTTNLISAGLTSISAMRTTFKVNQKYGAQVSAAEFMSNPTVEKLASLLDAGSCNKLLFGNVHPVREHYPMTAGQRLLYLSWSHNKDTIQYNIPSAWYIPIEDVGRMKDALIASVNVHPYMKTRLVLKDGDVVQQRRDECTVNITVVETGRELTREYVQSRIRPFNLDNDNLYRIEIHRSSVDIHRACVILDIHHIIADGLSLEIFRRDLRKALEGQVADAEPYSAYDFAIDQKNSVNCTEYGTAEKWYDSLISGKEVTVYPHSLEGLKEPALASVVSEFDGSAVDEYCKKHGFTQSNYFLTAFLYLLREVTREDDLLITAINNGRRSQMMNTIGMFVTTLPVSVSSGTPIWSGCVETAVETIQRQQFKSQNYDFYPFTEMVERHGIHAEIMYEYQGGITDCNDEMEAIDISLDVAKLPLMLSVDHGGDNGRYRMVVRYDQSLYSKEDMGRMVESFSFIAGKMASASSMDSIGLLDDSGVGEILALGTGPHLELDINCTFVKAFRKCAASRPDSLAVEDENGNHSYGELDSASDVLANALADAGVEPESFVTLLLGRTWFFPLSVIAVHKAGAAYVPLDPGYPMERLQYMIDDCRTKVLLTTRRDFEDKSRSGLDTGRTEVLFIEEMDLSAKAEPMDRSNPSGNALQIYTSGSTGKPKGAVLHQAGLWNLICSVRSIYGHTAKDRIASHRPFSFVSHVEDIFVILTVGGSLHIMPESIRRDPGMIHEYLDSHQITGCGFIASVTMLLLKNYKLNLRYITGGGELFSGVISSGSPQIIHSYGPTECTVHTSVFLLEKGKEYRRIPVGKPLPNNWIFVVSKDGKLLPRGIAGELCFAGIQVAKGYLNNPELTAEKFHDCPFVDRDRWNRPVRMYCTGDMVRWNEDGCLEHLGRIDNQVKLRGFRIEPGEIESAALKCEGVLSAVAAVKNETLVLYYTADRDIDFHWGALPDYMIPSLCVHLDRMPLNSNGKIDRKHLPDVKLSQAGRVAPSSEKERFIFEKVKALLGTDSFGVTDDLAHFGMNSIRAMKLALELPAEWEIKVSDVIGSRTVREIVREKHDTVWFHRKYDPSKKTVVMVHGIIGNTYLSELEDKLSESFNVLTVEHIYDTLLSRSNIDKLISRDGYNEFIRLYIRRIEEVMPVNGVISLILGFSLGGSLAYDIACEWNRLRGQEPVVVMGDSNLILSSESENEPAEDLSPEIWRERIRELHGNIAPEVDAYQEELLHTIRGGKKTLQEYGGKVIMLRAVHGRKINTDIKKRLKKGILYDVVKWFYWHLHIRNFVLDSRISDTWVVEAGQRYQSRNNISAWKQHKPDMEIIDINSTHTGLFCESALIPRYLELIRREVHD